MKRIVGLGIRAINPNAIVNKPEPPAKITFRRPKKSESQPNIGAEKAQPKSINDVKNAASDWSINSSF